MDSVLLGAVRKLLQQRGYVTSPRLCRTGRLLEPTCLASFKCKKVEHARDGSSIFGKYADRPTTVQPGQVVGVMALLMSGFSRAEAMDKMEAKMAEAKAQMGNDAIHVHRPDGDYQTLAEHES